MQKAIIGSQDEISLAAGHVTASNRTEKLGMEVNFARLVTHHSRIDV